MLTGGNPSYNRAQGRPGWVELLTRLRGQRRVHVETNGTHLPNRVTLGHCEVICVSPKLPNAGRHRGHQDPAVHPGLGDLLQDHPGLHLKVVCEDAADVRRAVSLADALAWPHDGCG